MTTYRKVIKDIEKKTPEQYHNMTINEVFVLDLRNTIGKLKTKNVGRLQDIQIGLIQESIRFIRVDGTMKIVIPIKEYNNDLKIIDKYDNNIKY